MQPVAAKTVLALNVVVIEKVTDVNRSFMHVHHHSFHRWSYHIRSTSRLMAGNSMPCLRGRAHSELLSSAIVSCSGRENRNNEARKLGLRACSDPAAEPLVYLARMIRLLRMT
jgi:hypothetical protein